MFRMADEAMYTVFQYGNGGSESKAEAKVCAQHLDVSFG